MGRIQITLPPPLPQHSTPIPAHPEIQTSYDGCSRDADGQHDTQAPSPSRAHDSREVQRERCYHPQRRSTCATNQSHSDTIADRDLPVFQTSVNISPTVTSVGHSSRDSTDPLVLPFVHIPPMLLNYMQVAPSLPRKARIYLPMVDISFKPNNSWTGNTVSRDSAMTAVDKER